MLAELDRLRIVHTDLNPESIIMQEGGMLKIVNLGKAQELNSG